MNAEQRLVQGEVRTRLDRFERVAFESTHTEPFVPEWYIQPFCFALQTAAEAERCSLLVTMPPRHGKSFALICLAAFTLANHPATKIAIAVYGEELAREHMKYFRQIVNQRWFRATFPDFQIAKGGERLDAIETTQNGGLRIVSVGGSITGMGVNLLIIDDIIKAQDAGSAAMREAAERFVNRTCSTRFNDPRRPRIIFVTQRLHPHDLPGKLIARGDFQHLNLPSIATQETILPTYGGRQYNWAPGMLLSSRRFLQPELDRLEKSMGSVDFAAQFLQAPTFADGVNIAYSRLRLVDAPFAKADLKYVFISVDPAISKSETACFSALAVFGYNGEHWCVMDVVRRRLDFGELRAAALHLAKNWNADLMIIEHGHIGLALWGELRSLVKHVYCSDPPTQDKSERLAVVVDKLYAGEVEFPKNESWSDAALGELRSFPDGPNDFVDTITQFLAWLRGRSMEAVLESKERFDE